MGKNNRSSLFYLSDNQNLIARGSLKALHTKLLLRNGYMLKVKWGKGNDLIQYTFVNRKYQKNQKMKKIILIAAIIGLGNSLIAQTGSLKIDNFSDPCDVYVTMYAVDPSTSVADGVPCSIMSTTIRVGNGIVMGWPSVWAFTPGWASIPTSISQQFSIKIKTCTVVRFSSREKIFFRLK